jgi:hypothetical protein
MWPDFGMPGADNVESPRTWTPFTAFDSQVRQSTSHQRLLCVISSDGVEVGAHRHRAAVDGDHLRVAPVLDHAGVELLPGALEERPLGSHIGIRVEHQHLRARLRALEVVRDLRHALVGSRRAAIRRERDGEHVDAAIPHGLQLPAQGERLRARLPGVRHAVLRRLVALDFVEVEIDAGR